MLTTRRLLRTVVRAACAPRLKILKLCPGFATANVWGSGLTSELCALAKACPLLEVVEVTVVAELISITSSWACFLILKRLSSALICSSKPTLSTYLAAARG